MPMYFVANMYNVVMNNKASFHFIAASYFKRCNHFRQVQSIAFYHNICGSFLKFDFIRIKRHNIAYANFFSENVLR